jgi:hypothetical protein
VDVHDRDAHDLDVLGIRATRAKNATPARNPPRTARMVGGPLGATRCTGVGLPVSKVLVKLPPPFNWSAAFLNRASLVTRRGVCGV